MFTLRELLIQLNADATVHGVLVTHGTDTMEDMLFFLSLTLPDLQKPIVFTGSMLTSDSPNSDAQKNVADSVRLLTVASSAAARGVDSHLVSVKDVPKLFGLVMNGKFTSAHQVQKKCTNGVDAFDLPASLSIDSLIKGQFTASLEVQTNKISLPALSVAQFNTKLQQFVLDLVYCTPNMQVGSISSRIKCLDANQADQVGATSHKTVIVAAPGNGNIPSRFIAELKELMSSGVRVVRASRIAHSPLRQGGELTGLETFVNADLMKVDSSRSPVTFGDYHEALGLSLNQVVIMETCRFLSENSID
jgi:L-asparaginase